MADHERLEEMLDKKLRRLLKKSGVRHAAMGAMSGDGQFHWTGAVGDARHDGSEMTNETPFMTASVTKLFIAAGILCLHESGQIDIEKPAAEFLPAGLMDGIHSYKGTDYSNKITVEHLLTHSSGIPDWLEDRPKSGKSMIEQILLEEDRLISVPDLLEPLKEKYTPLFSPSDLSAQKVKIRYSDTNFQILSAILEHQFGEGVDVVFDKLFFQPLDLNNTFLPYGDSLEQRGGADFWFAKKPFRRPLLTASFRDLYSTSDDLLKFMRALIEGDVFKDRQTAKIMSKKWNRFSFPLDAAAMRLPSWPIQYGAGMMRWKLPRLYSPFWDIPAVVGHTGVTGSWLFYCPDYDLYLCGAVSQLYQAPLPFRLVPNILNQREVKRGFAKESG